MNARLTAPLPTGLVGLAFLCFLIPFPTVLIGHDGGRGASSPTPEAVARALENRDAGKGRLRVR